MNPQKSKIKSLKELAQVSLEMKRAGKTVVLCHGVFDLLHLGHLRHFKAAALKGDFLIVTVTGDEWVNKGPGRPVFNDIARLEMLSELACVDAVGVNYSDDSVNVIELIKPDVYVKGSDYKDSDKDITGKITDERNAVEANGGRLFFTEEITFSSSNLINNFLGVYETDLRNFLGELKAEKTFDELLLAIEELKSLRVLFIGDAIIDEYQYVSAMGKSAKENMIATHYQSNEVFAGGVFASANHLASFCEDVEVISVIGTENSFKDLIEDSLKPNVKATLLERVGALTTLKRRFVDVGYSVRKLFEVYFMETSPLPRFLKMIFIKFYSKNYRMLIW